MEQSEVSFLFANLSLIEMIVGMCCNFGIHFKIFGFTSI